MQSRVADKSRKGRFLRNSETQKYTLFAEEGTAQENPREGQKEQYMLQLW